MQIFSLAPSDFAWLLDECPRCFYFKARRLYRPDEAFPKVFRHIDGGMKGAYGVEALRSLGVKAARIAAKTRVLSEPIEFEEFGVALQLGGELDKLPELDDGSYAVLDFKTTHSSDQVASKYSRQLHAYQLGLERPAQGRGLQVTQLGLIVFDASEGSFKRDGKGACAQTGTEHFVPIEIDRSRFYKTLARVAEILAAQEIPASGSLCQVCRYYFDRTRMIHDLEARTPKPEALSA